MIDPDKWSNVVDIYVGLGPLDQDNTLVIELNNGRRVVVDSFWLEKLSHELAKAQRLQK